MHTATITLKKIWPPFKPTDKRTNVEDTTGKKWRVDIGLVGQFSDGDTCAIGYTREAFNGKDYDLIKNMQHAGGAPPHVVKAGNGNGEIDIRSIFGLMHSYNGKLPTISQMVLDLRHAKEALQLFEKDAIIEDLGDTFDN